MEKILLRGFLYQRSGKTSRKILTMAGGHKKLVAMHDIKPRGPVTRRLLELAENPPLLAQKI
jgi:hypothetical protein